MIFIICFYYFYGINYTMHYIYTLMKNQVNKIYKNFKIFALIIYQLLLLIVLPKLLKKPFRKLEVEKMIENYRIGRRRMTGRAPTEQVFQKCSKSAPKVICNQLLRMTQPRSTIARK